MGVPCYYRMDDDWETVAYTSYPFFFFDALSSFHEQARILVLNHDLAPWLLHTETYREALRPQCVLHLDAIGEVRVGEHIGLRHLHAQWLAWWLELGPCLTMDLRHRVACIHPLKHVTDIVVN